MKLYRTVIIYISKTNNIWNWKKRKKKKKTLKIDEIIIDVNNKKNKWQKLMLN